VTRVLPKEVVCGPSAHILRRLRPFTVIFTVLALIPVAGSDGWIALLMMLFVPWLAIYDLRLRRSRIVFTPDSVHVRAIFRWAQFPTSVVTEIVLSARPGIVSVKTSDGGSAVVTMSGNGVEFAPEKKLRLHQLAMLERMYDSALLRVRGRDGSVGMNRSSPSVKWRWIPFTRTEYMILVATFIYGMLCALF